MKEIDIVENILTEQVITFDMFFSSKLAINNYASILSKINSKEIQDILKKQLLAAISYHHKIFNYMIGNGYYRFKDINEEITLLCNYADKVLNNNRN